LRAWARAGQGRRHTSKESQLADEALFIGWGEVVRGRESKSLDVFNEALQYYRPRVAGAARLGRSRTAPVAAGRMRL